MRRILLGLGLALATNASAIEFTIRFQGETATCIGCTEPTPVPTPRPPRPTQSTPGPTPTCPPDRPVPCPFGCCGTPRPGSPVASATPDARLVGGVLKEGGAWEVVDDFQEDLYGWDYAYQLNPERAVRFFAANGRSIAPNEVWSCGVNLPWQASHAERQVLVENAWERIEPWLQERLDTQRFAGVPELTCAETGTYYWAAGKWGSNGFCAGLNAKGNCRGLKPVSKWPRAFLGEYLWLFRKWREAGGGPIVFAPYVFTGVSLQTPDWLDHARRNEPALFAGFNWDKLAPDSQIDQPTTRAWRVARKALERWVAKVSSEMLLENGDVIPFRIVSQISNSIYPKSPWQDLAVRDLPKITRDVQVELVDGIDCPLVLSLQANRARVSAWSYTLALSVRDGLACD